MKKINKEIMDNPFCPPHKWQIYDVEKDKVIAEDVRVLPDRFLANNQDKIDLSRLECLYLFKDGEPYAQFKPSYKIVRMD